MRRRLAWTPPGKAGRNAPPPDGAAAPDTGKAATPESAPAAPAPIPLRGAFPAPSPPRAAVSTRPRPPRRFESPAASGTRWPLAFRRAIGAAIKDEEDLAFVAGRLDEVLERATG